MGGVDKFVKMVFVLGCPCGVGIDRESMAIHPVSSSRQ